MNDTPGEMLRGWTYINQNRSILVNDKWIHLSRQEFALFKTLLQNEDVVPDRVLENVLWNSPYHSRSALHVLACQLRKKIECDPSHPQFFLRVRSEGYKLATI